MEKHTHREYLTWMEYLEQQEATPSSQEYYLMQIAAEVRRVLHRSPGKVKIQDFKLSFSSPDPTKESMTQKQYWLMGLGIKDTSNG